MKKKLVSKDPLAEKIEEILTPYPDPMSRNDRGVLRPRL